jgi:Zn-dependent M16 (insulinase) family peptidase
MTIVHGFEPIREEEIREYDTLARLFRHAKTGARLLSLENNDENKVFGITFRTPPPDSTGLPHIMEHSVLSGSRKYPVKEPFVELVKGSLNTFLNAMTFPDKTCYPVASQNLQDFYNLIDVYLDAVFYALISPHTLEQEGWHYELENPDDPLAYKGVVFNEMKGAYSSPDSLLARYSQRSVFPGNNYGLDSGGDPEVIPDLTYEQFRNFHRTYYHPSNAYIFFYGDDDPQERLRLMDEYLKDFEPIQVDSAVPLQTRFEQPQRVSYPYDASEGGNGAQKSMLTVNWMLTDSNDPEIVLGLSILSHILIGTPASPLRKALIESGLGEDLTGGGLEPDLRQMLFSTGLKGVAEENTGPVETLILDTLTGVAQGGLEPDMVEASVNTIEFRLRENNTGSYPRGLALMLRALTTWLYDADPVLPLRFEAPFETIKERLAAGEPYFENLIREYLLDNPHRVTVILEPDPALREAKERREAARLAEARAAMDEEALRQVIRNTRELKLRQETPDSPEALATIPTLTLADLEREGQRIPLRVTAHNGRRVLYHDLFTSGILYLDVGFDLQALPAELLPYVSLFGDALVEIGTEEEDFVKLAQRIGRETGGLWPTTFASTVVGSDENAVWLFLRGKSTIDKSQELLAILQDVLLTVKLDEPTRFKQMVLESKAGTEAGLIPGGHRVINGRLRARFDKPGWAAEQMDGLDQLFFLRRLAQEVEENWPAVLEKLEQVRAALIKRDNMIFNVTLDAANWSGFEPQLNGFIDQLPAGAPQRVRWPLPASPANEGLTIPAQVNYVGKAARLYDLGYEMDGSVAVITHYLGSTWLWERIRVQGGAYGGFCVFDHRSGVLTFLSYRDPNLLGTLQNYDRTGQFLRDLELPEEELIKSIIGAIGRIDAYQLPDAKGYTSMLRHLTADTDEGRQRRREQVLSATAADFTAFGAVLEEVARVGQVAVMGSQEALEKANEERDGSFEITKVL